MSYVKGLICEEVGKDRQLRCRVRLDDGSEFDCTLAEQGTKTLSLKDGTDLRYWYGPTCMQLF